MPLARHAVADLQGLALPSRSIPTTASPDIFWQSKPHSKIGKQCKTSVARTGPPITRLASRSGNTDTARTKAAIAEQQKFSALLKMLRVSYEHARSASLVHARLCPPGRSSRFSLCRWGSPFNQRVGPFVMRSDRKSRLITICMLASAIVMIGLALTGTLQMRVSHSPITALSQIDRP